MADANNRVATKTGKNSGGKAADSRSRAQNSRTNSDRTASRATKKRTPAKATGKRSTSTPKRTGTTKRTAPHLAEVQPSTKPRKVTMNRRTQTITLRTDLQKFSDERYAPEDFINGAQLIIDAGAGERLRDLVASVLRSKGAFGNMQSEHVMEGLLDQLSDGYRKRKVAERKSIRAMLNWCSGLVETEQEVEGQLLLTVLSQGAGEE